VLCSAHEHRPGAAVVDGFSRQVVACRDQNTGRIFGFGCRSLRELYVNGQPTVVGYLSSLRVLPEYRNRGLVARGYAFFRRLHADGRTPFYLTTIAEGNETALQILTSGRAGLPMYHAAGRYHTIAIALPRRGPIIEPASATNIRSGARSPWSSMIRLRRGAYPLTGNRPEPVVSNDRARDRLRAV
jgi:hypothetical protein